MYIYCTKIVILTHINMIFTYVKIAVSMEPGAKKSHSNIKHICTCIYGLRQY